MAKTNKTTETLIIQLLSLCRNQAEKDVCVKIEAEFAEVDNVGKKFPFKRNVQLYKVLHITRFLDTSLRLFLDIHDCRGNCHSIGDYIKALAKPNKGLSQLNSDLRKRYINDIADVRNKFLHTSGQRPNQHEFKEIRDKIHECLQTTLSLHL